MGGRHVQSQVGSNKKPDCTNSQGADHAISINLRVTGEGVDVRYTGRDGIRRHSSQKKGSGKLEDRRNLRVNCQLKNFSVCLIRQLTFQQLKSLIYNILQCGNVHVYSNLGETMKCMYFFLSQFTTTLIRSLNWMEGGGQHALLTMTACLRVRVLLPTDVPKALATSLAPGFSTERPTTGSSTTCLDKPKHRLRTARPETFFYEFSPVMMAAWGRVHGLESEFESGALQLIDPWRSRAAPGKLVGHEDSPVPYPKPKATRAPTTTSHRYSSRTAMKKTIDGSSPVETYAAAVAAAL